MNSPFAGSRARPVAALVTVALFQVAATIAVARGVHGAVDGTWPGGTIVPLLIALAAAAFALETIQRRVGDGIGLAHAARIREALFEHLLRVRPDIVQRRREGAMLQSFVGDLTAQRLWVSEGVMRAIVALITLAAITLWTALDMTGLALAFVVTTLTGVLSGGLLLRALDSCMKEVRRSRGKVSALAAERLTVTATVAAFGRQKSETGRLANRVERLNRASYRRAWLTGALRGLPHLSTSCLLIFLAARNAGSSAGAITAAVMLIGFFGMALRDLARAGELWISGSISRQRIEGLLALPTVPQRQGKKRRKRRRDEGAALVFDRLVLKRRSPPINLRAGQGAVVLVDGTLELRQQLIWVLAGLYPPHSGAVRWNGADLAKLSPGTRRRTIGLCGPEFPLLRGSVAMNLRYRRPDLSPMEVAAEAEAWGLDLKAENVDASALSIARALLGTPPLLVLNIAEGHLADRSLERLRNILPSYPGVVLLMTSRLELRLLGTETWLLTPEGVTRTVGPVATGPLAIPAASNSARALP